MLPKNIRANKHIHCLQDTKSIHKNLLHSKNNYETKNLKNSIYTCIEENKMTKNKFFQRGERSLH